MLSSLLLLCSSAHAASVDGVRPAVLNPLGPRGSVMMIPLTAERPGDDWPGTLEVRFDSGQRVEGEIAWVQSARSASTAAQWTDDPRGLVIRAIDRHDDTSKTQTLIGGVGPYLLLRVPQDTQGSMKVGNLSISPIWCDVPWNDPLQDERDAAPESILQLTNAPDRPDADSPFEYWRWVLLADRLGLNAPAPVGDDLQRRAAEHYAVLWRIGLQRIGLHSQRIATECRAMLTRTALDRGRPIATWIADPQQCANLLATLLDFRSDSQVALSGAVAWLAQQNPFMLWPEDESGDRVRLALTSLRDDVLTVRFRWLGSEQPASSIHLDAGVVAHVTIDRLPLQPSPRLGAGGLIEPAEQVLRVEADGRSIDLICGERINEARPPGVTLGPLKPPLTLAGLAINRVSEVALDRSTIVQIRRLGGRWEAFFECRRTAEQQQTLDRAALREYDDLRGIEAVTLLLEPAEGEAAHSVWLTVPEHDWPAVVRGTNLPDLRVHKRSFADRWTCRIVLPDEWFSAAETDPAYVGFIRSHGDGQQLETGPAPSPPWRTEPGRIAIDLKHWDDLPSVDEPATK